MTPHQSLALGVRLFSIFLGVYVAREVLWLAFDARNYGEDFVRTMAIAFAVIGSVVCAITWMFPKLIARFLLNVPDDAPAPSASPDEWLATGASLIGLWLAVSAVPGLFRTVAALLVYRNEPMDTRGVALALAYSGSELAIGIGLILGCAGIARMMAWARTAGRP